MKKLILILMVGSLFGDTIRYKEGLLLAKTKVNVEFLGVSDKKVYFKLLNTKNATHLTSLELNVEDDTDTHYDFEEEESVDGIATQIILKDMRRNPQIANYKNILENSKSHAPRFKNIR